MKKILKAFTVAIIAITAALACVFVAGCNGDKEAKSDYNFTIVFADGTALNGLTDGPEGTDGKVPTQICIGTDNCFPLNYPYEIYPDENGKLSLSQKQVNEIFSTSSTLDTSSDITEFDFHVMYVPGCYWDVKIAVNGKGDYTVFLEAE